MKKPLAIAALILGAALISALAQLLMVGAPHGPDFSGVTGKLFGENQSFSASLEMQSASSSAVRGSIAVSDGKSRFEMDLIKAPGNQMTPQQVALIQSTGMGRMVMISRPDLKVTRMVYPNMNAYAEMPLPDSSSSGSAASYKMDITKLGEETVHGHPCVKNKAVVTDDRGVQHESTVWNATDLKNFPIKIEQNENGAMTTMTFKDVKLDKVAADKFEVPAGSTKYDNMGAMMQQEMTKRAMQNHGNP